MTKPAVPFSTPWVAINEQADDPVQSQHHRRSWSLDIHRPSIFNLCTPSERDEEPLKLYVGGRGSGVPLHSHAASWNLLITGVKRWFFIAPGHARDGTLDGSKTDLSSPETQHQTVSTTARWLTEVAPDLLRSGVISEIVQYPGDVIFIPHDWMHATFNEADSVAVAQVPVIHHQVHSHYCTSLLTPLFPVFHVLITRNFVPFDTPTYVSILWDTLFMEVMIYFEV